MIRILGRSDSLNVRKVLWGLDELGVPFEREDYGGPFGGTDTPEYRRLNPNGLVPTLIDGAVAVWESNTILRYLAERFDRPDFGGADAAARAGISRWMDWQLGTLNVPLQTLFTQMVRLKEDARDPKLVTESLKAIHAALRVLGEALAGGEDFICGARVTAADCALGVSINRYFTLVAEPEVTQSVTAYRQRIAARPGFIRHVAIGKP